jgi:hypothetical protein
MPSSTEKSNLKSLNRVRFPNRGKEFEKPDKTLKSRFFNIEA